MNFGNLLHLLATTLTVIFSVDGHNITCIAPPAVRGQPANVTCHFGRDISKEKRDFKIHKYDPSGHSPDIVLSCHWNGDITGPSCKVKPGYVFNRKVSESATLQINNASKNSVGTYVCQATPAVKEDNLGNCFFDVKDPEQPVVGQTATCHPSDKEDGNAVPALVAIVVVLSVGVVGLVIALIITIRRLLELKRAVKDKGERVPLLEYAYDAPRPPVRQEIPESGLKALLLGSCRANQIQMVMWLIESGAPADCHDKVNGDTPLHVACRCGHETILKVLLHIGVDIEARNDKGFTPLHKACKYGRTSLVKALIEEGANVNAFGREYTTPLKLALENDNTGVINILLRAGATLDEEDIKRMTPLLVDHKTDELVKAPLNYARRGPRR